MWRHLKWEGPFGINQEDTPQTSPQHDLMEAIPQLRLPRLPGDSHLCHNDQNLLAQQSKLAQAERKQARKAAFKGWSCGVMENPFHARFQITS